MAKEMSTVSWIAFILLVIGGLNWALVGLFNFNLVMTIFSDLLSRIIYVLVGISAIYMIFSKK